MSQLNTLGQVFSGVFRVADNPIDIMGYWIAPLDIWLTTAIIYMLLDIFLSYMWGENNE